MRVKRSSSIPRREGIIVISMAWGGISGNTAATSSEQEGALIKSFKLASEGKFDEEGEKSFSAYLPPVMTLIDTF
jgi:hypothetical protein